MRFSLNLANAPQKLLPKVKESLRKKVPLLTRNELRRLKIPLNQALYAELLEDGHPKGFKIFEKIMETDRNHKGQLHTAKTKASKKLLLLIFEHLKNFESLSPKEEVESLLQLVEKLLHLSSAFDWLIECIFLQATAIVTAHKLEGSATDALVRFRHGSSLYRRLRWYRAAVVHFEYALHLSLQLADQLTSNLIALELSSCLVDFSKELRKNNKNSKNSKAIDEALIAAKRAITVLRRDLKKENVEHELHAEVEYASCWFARGNYENALSHFEHAASLAEFCALTEKYCECLIFIAECCYFLENHDKQMNCLTEAEKIANENSFELLAAKIATNFMKFYMIFENEEKVEENFRKAFEIFEAKQEREEREKLECLYAKFKANSTFNTVVDTVLKVDKGERGNNRDLKNLIDWMDHASTDIFKESSQMSLREFIATYYDPDEVTRVQQSKDGEDFYAKL